MENLSRLSPGARFIVRDSHFTLRGRVLRVSPAGVTCKVDGDVVAEDFDTADGDHVRFVKTQTAVKTLSGATRVELED